MFESLAERVKEQMKFFSNLPKITCAASLAHHGLLGSVRELRLDDIDLTSVPAEHLASLASCVINKTDIRNVSGCDLVTILDNVKSEQLYIWRQSLGSEETQAMVRAMESGVEEGDLYAGVKLDIGDLIKYNGQGKCERVECFGETVTRYSEQLRTWATSRNWEVILDEIHHFYIEKIQQNNQIFYIL